MNDKEFGDLYSCVTTLNDTEKSVSGIFVFVLLTILSVLNSYQRKKNNKYFSENKGPIFPKNVLRKF